MEKISINHCSASLSLLVSGLVTRLAPLDLVRTLVLRETTPPTQPAVLVGRLDTSPAERTVTVGPPVLAGAGPAHLAVDVGLVDPEQAVRTVAVLRSRQGEV